MLVRSVASSRDGGRKKVVGGKRNPVSPEDDSRALHFGAEIEIHTCSEFSPNWVIPVTSDLSATSYTQCPAPNVSDVLLV